MNLKIKNETKSSFSTGSESASNFSECLKLKQQNREGKSPKLLKAAHAEVPPNNQSDE